MQQNSTKMLVTLEKYNRKGSSDSFFFRISEAKEFYSELNIPLEKLGDAGAISWNTSGFAGLHAHFETGSQVFAVIDIIDTDEVRQDKNGVERERINFRLITDLTPERRAADIQTALRMLAKSDSSATKRYSRFAPKESNERDNTQRQIDELISQGVPTTSAEKKAYEVSLNKLQEELETA